MFGTICIAISTLLTVNLSQAQSQPDEIRDGGNYKIRNVGNQNFLTVLEQGIVGLRTGMVGTLPENQSLTQGWTLTWKPLRTKHQGYWIQSRREYLNTITAFYPPSKKLVEGSLDPITALLNIWNLKYLGGGAWQIRNVRTNNCLQVIGKLGKKSNNRVNEGSCLESGTKQELRQQWNLIRVIVAPEEEEILL